VRRTSARRTEAETCLGLVACAGALASAQAPQGDRGEREPRRLREAERTLVFHEGGRTDGPAWLLAIGAWGRQGRSEPSRIIADALSASARDGFRSAGLGVVMTADDRKEVWYATMEDLRVALLAAPELEGPVSGAEEAGAGYDPETEAVVVESRHGAVSVVLVREADIITLGALAFVDPAWRY
jgi:hypothetical protein